MPGIESIGYWEHKTWFEGIDHVVTGAGIVGLSCAITLKEREPRSRVLVVDSGRVPGGASSRNAGFACFGSPSEVLADLRREGAPAMLELVGQRWRGIQRLRERLGDAALRFQGLGGHELFLKDDGARYAACLEALPELNALLRPIFGSDPYEAGPDPFGFSGILPQVVTHVHEGQLDTGAMIRALMDLARARGIDFLPATRVEGFGPGSEGVDIETDMGTLKAGRLFLAVNGFAPRLGLTDVLPARAQVLVTAPIANLPFRGTFHFDEGYYYFRDIDGRVLFGGGRNLNLEGETTDAPGTTTAIQGRLETLLRTVILPGRPFTVERRWSGTMGVGEAKRPEIRQLADGVYAAYRLGGMGVAIGSHVGEALASLYRSA